MIHVPFPVFILRHGQTSWNVEGRMQGRRDSPLTELGLAQAAAQAEIMALVRAAFPDLSFYSSPLGRAARTAEIAFSGGHVTPDARLSEVSAGAWEGRLRADVVAEQGGDAAAADEAQMFDLFLSAPDGEREGDLAARVDGFLDGLTAPTAVVSHGVVSAYLRGRLLGLPRTQIAGLSHRQGCVWMISEGREICLGAPQEARAALGLPEVV